MNKRIVILGLGNLLNSDEGVGIHALRRLQSEWHGQDSAIEFVDGGTLGLNLLPMVENTTHLLLLDCINASQEPGMVMELEKTQIPLFSGIKMSIHQLTFQEVLGLAKVRGHLPDQICLLGVQPSSLEIGTELSPLVEARLPLLIERAHTILHAWSVSGAVPPRPASII